MVRLMAGFVIGGFLSVVALLLVWTAVYGLDVLGLTSGWVLFAPIVAAVLFAVVYAARPVDKASKLVGLAVAGVALGALLGFSTERAVAQSCDLQVRAGIEPEGLCAGPLPALGIVWHAVAGGLLGLFAGLLGTHVPPAPSDRESGG